MRKKIWEYKGYQEYKNENPDTFKEHVAVFQKLNVENDCVIIFQKPNSGEGAMKFVYVDGVLTIQGDYGYASFNWHNPRNHILAYGGFDSFGYVLSKLVSVKDDELYGWDEDLFHKEFREFVEDRKEGGYIEKDEEVDEPSCYGLHDVASHFQNIDEEYGQDLFETNAYTLGRYVTERPYLWWYGLQTALNYLEGQGVFNK